MGPRPCVLVFPNYAGLKQFDTDQALFLARVGYVGVAVDLYRSTEEYPRSNRNPLPPISERRTRAQRRTHPLLQKHFMGATNAANSLLRDLPRMRRFCGAWLEAARRHTAVDVNRTAAIGYCLGGMCILEMLRAGLRLDGIVSFHGILQSRPLNMFSSPDFDGSFIPVSVHHVLLRPLPVSVAV